jgi:protein-disulfide isomerase
MLRAAIGPTILCSMIACARPGAVAGPEAGPERARARRERVPARDPHAEIERFHVPLGDAPVRGPATASVTVVMFSDFECPYCERGHETLLELARRYPQDVRIAYKAYPLDFHGYALFAAMAARSAQAQGKFWDFHDRLYSKHGLDVPRVFQYAEEVGLDLDALRRDLDGLEHGPAVARDIRQARRLGVTATPTFFVNGRVMDGARPIDEFADLVDEEIALAKQWRSEGVAAEDIYEHAIRDGFREIVYSQGDRRLDPDTVVPVPIGDSPVRGPAEAPVTIVVFGDFECPYCARGFATLESLRERYGERLRIVYKHFPLSFHSRAFVAARASEAAKAQGKFWAFHDALYTLGAKFDEDDLSGIAKQAGLDGKKFARAMQDATLDRAIERDQQLALSLGVGGTPAFFINGRPLEGAQPEVNFRIVIEEELDRAAAAVARGTAPADVYEKLSHQPLEDDPT